MGRRCDLLYMLFCPFSYPLSGPTTGIVVRVAESLDTGSAAGRLVLNIMAAVSQWEREAIGERTRAAMRHKRSQGERVGNIEFGYRLSPDGRHLESDSAENRPHWRKSGGCVAKARRCAGLPPP